MSDGQLQSTQTADEVTKLLLDWLESLRTTRPAIQPADEVTKLLLDWNNGDAVARDRLITIVYNELLQMAHLQLLRERPGHTLEANELVTEVYLRLFGLKEMQWQDRAHFFTIAARLMRRVLVEEAHRRNSQKHAAGAPRIPFDEAMAVSREHDEELIALDKALDRLAQYNKELMQVVELRYFAGLSTEETADALGVPADVVKREYRKARMWLYHKLSGEQEQDVKSLDLSASRLAIYLLASTVVASILLQLLTDDEIVIFFGTLNLAIISAWIWAWLRKIRSTLRHFKGAQQNRPEQPLLGELGNARQR